jgi:hypothetical protein
MAAFGRDLPQLGDTKAYGLAPNQRLVMGVGDPAGKVALAARLGGPDAFATLIHPRPGSRHRPSSGAAPWSGRSPTSRPTAGQAIS